MRFKLLLFLARLSKAFNIQFVWFVFYKLGEWVGLLIVRESELLVWSRNSFPLGYSVPPISDLDMTIVYDKRINSLDEVRIKIKKLKFWVPLVREVNVYELSDIDFIKNIMNSFELKRDDCLKIKFDLDVMECESEAFTFIWKSFSTDLEGLNKRIWSRERRWRFILKSIGFKSSRGISLNLIQSVIVEYSKGTISNDYIEAFSKKKTTDSQDVWSEVWFIRPVEYLIYSFNTFGEIRLPVDVLSDFQQKVLINCFEWEVWGLYTQIYNTSSLSSFKDHIKNLETLILPKLEQKRAEYFKEIKDKFLMILESH